MAKDTRIRVDDDFEILESSTLSAGSSIITGMVGLSWEMTAIDRILEQHGTEEQIQARMKELETRLKEIFRWYLQGPGQVNFDHRVYYVDPVDFHIVSLDSGYVSDPMVRIPVFPSQGRWHLTLVERPGLGEVVEYGIVSFYADVGESSIGDHLFAPVYISWSGTTAANWGEFAIMLPCLFFLSSPIWGFALFILVLSIWKMSFRKAVLEVKLGMAEMKKRFKWKGGKKNEKKKVKKSTG